MKISILGFGLQGKSAYDYYKSEGNEIVVCDRYPVSDIPDGIESQIGDNYLDRLDRFDLIVRSPKVHPKDIVQVNSEHILDKVTSNTNEFFRVCPTRNVIGVTGTKGKGTTATLITRMLEASGLKVHLGGNIGIPPLDLLKGDIQPDDWVVLELANFQLIDLKYSSHIAICLLVEPEHLDWHTDTDEYYEAKTQLFRNQTAEDISIYYGVNENSKRIASTGAARLIPYYQSPGAFVEDDHISIDGKQVIRLDEIKLLGKHNWQNVCAAITAAWQIKPDIEAIYKTIRDFSGLAFRIEPIRSVNGVTYYNDSFASAPPATIAAIEAIKSSKVLIIGGKDRGLDLSALCQSVKQNSENMRKVLLIGESAERMAQCLSDAGYDNYESGGTNMNQIVQKASVIAENGDSIILSPAFPSFDMFENFEDRGIQFNAAVGNL
jgi:UDP-N-acetylmuramoylalanine--D-glutamate ligase